MELTKPFLSYAQQLDKLEQEKSLIIPDRAYAEQVLRDISYFALISGYKELFRNPTTKKYKDGTTFDEIVALYNFDEELRGLFLKALFTVERKLRSLMSYYFTQQNGSAQTAYLDIANYTSDPRLYRKSSELVSRLQILASSEDYGYIRYQRERYGNVPLWVLVNALSFGSLSIMYRCFPQNLQTAVSRNFKGVNEKELQQYLSVLTKFRNVCAHNERLFSYRTKDSIPDTTLHDALNIPLRGTQFIYGKSDLFAVVIAIRYLLPKETSVALKNSLEEIIGRFLKSTDHVSENILLERMGFPFNWTTLSELDI